MAAFFLEASNLGEGGGLHENGPEISAFGQVESQSVEIGRTGLKGLMWSQPLA